MAGQVPTASGFHRHRSVDAPLASAGLEPVLAAVADAGGVPIAHCCASDVPVELLRGAGAQGVSFDLGIVAASAYDQIAVSLEAGDWVFLGVVPSTDSVLDAKAVTARAMRFFDMVGLAPTPTTVLTPTCGLAGATPEYARRALELAAAAASSCS